MTRSEFLTLKTIHVNVRLKGERSNGDWRIEWRQVQAKNLTEAITIAQAMPDVQHVYESSFIAGGVIT